MSTYFAQNTFFCHNPQDNSRQCSLNWYIDHPAFDLVIRITSLDFLKIVYQMIFVTRFELDDIILLSNAVWSYRYIPEFPSRLLPQFGYKFTGSYSQKTKIDLCTVVTSPQWRSVFWDFWTKTFKYHLDYWLVSPANILSNIIDSN